MRFRVPEGMESGVYRAGVGRFGPGQEYEVPDAASPRDENGDPLPYKPHHLMEPCDDEADACLVANYPERAKAGTLARFNGADGKPKAKNGKNAKADSDAKTSRNMASPDKADGPLGYTGK